MRSAAKGRCVETESGVSAKKIFLVSPASSEPGVSVDPMEKKAQVVSSNLGSSSAPSGLVCRSRAVARMAAARLGAMGKEAEAVD